jgi:Ser-tRNA(Ala) deacylase AlaX
MEEMDVNLIQKAIKQSNEIISRNLPVEIYYLSRGEAEKDTDLFKLAMDFPHNLESYRIVDIKGFDRQADGGCHVRSLIEIGRIQFKEAVSKGRHNKRVYFIIE